MPSLMKYVLFATLLVHAFIHSLGFRQAFALISVHQFTRRISKTNGILWLLATILFTMAGILVVVQSNTWWLVSAPAILLSQYLIFTSWRDAKYGTLVNLVLLAATFNYANWNW